MDNKEQAPEGISISTEEAVVIDTISSTSTNNDVPAVDTTADKIPDAEIADAEKEVNKKPEGAPPHSAAYYKSFANMAHGGIDKLYEMINEFMFLPSDKVDKRGIKKRMPLDYDDMVDMLAQQLEASKVEIKGMIGWILYGNFVVTSYTALIKENLNVRREVRLKNKPDGKEQVVESTNEAKVYTPTFKTEKEDMPYAKTVRTEKKIITKRGNPAFHSQPCDCAKCRVKRGLPPEVDVQITD